MSTTNHWIFLIAKYLFALHLIIFGANKWLGFADVPPPDGETAQLFLGAMFTSYLAKLVGATQVLGGLLMLFRRTQFLGFLLLLPVIANIVCFHLAHAMPGNGLWIFTLTLTIILAYFYRPQFEALLLPSKPVESTFKITNTINQTA